MPGQPGRPREAPESSPRSIRDWSKAPGVAGKGLSITGNAFALPQKHSRPRSSRDSAATASAATPQALATLLVRQRLTGNTHPATPGAGP